MNMMLLENLAYAALSYPKQRGSHFFWVEMVLKRQGLSLPKGCGEDFSSKFLLAVSTWKDRIGSP